MNLISIGELSQLTGIGVKSLRYYERINVLKPAYVNPDSGYRYYSLDQVHAIDIITACIELDIPLKELAEFTEHDNIINLRKFLNKGKQIAEKKIKALNKVLRAVSELEKKIDLAESYPMGQIYTRELPKMYLRVEHCSSPIDEMSLLQMIKSFFEVPLPEDDLNYQLEYGFLRENSPEGALYHAFIEVPKHMATKHGKTAPAGEYFCIQSDTRQIEHTHKIFKKHIKNNHLAIETEIYTGRHKITKPINELRLINLE